MNHEFFWLIKTKISTAILEKIDIFLARKSETSFAAKLLTFF